MIEPELGSSRTESLHSDSPRSDDPLHWLTLFAEEEPRLAAALIDAAPGIFKLGNGMAAALAGMGRVIYVGAGTSGRLGVLDAAEWGPTFGIAPGRVIARIAGGDRALTSAVEGAEDDGAAGRQVIRDLETGWRDLVVGISASGGAEFVRAALAEARDRGSQRGWITASTDTLVDDDAARVVLDLGPELLAGSTRLKAATATHRVLGRASCICALQLGWIHRGRMVEMRPTNRKLRARAERIVAELAGISTDEAARVLVAAGDDIKVAIVSAALHLEPGVARDRLREVGRRLDAFEELS